VRLMLFAGGSGASGILATARCAPACSADTDNITAANNAMAACLKLQESEDRNQYRLKAKGGRGFTCEVLLICDLLH
jgi:hypothetical protein